MPCSRQNRAMGTMSGSIRSLTATALSLIGRSRPGAAASIPASTRPQIVAAGDLHEALAVERIEVDVEAAQAGIVESGRAVGPSSTALVVRARSWMPGMASSFSMSTGRSRRTSGSPPVRRSLVTPCAAATRATRSISSKLRISSRAWNFTPLFGHAVEAADIAAIGNADAQAVVEAAEPVAELRCH